jgi:diguanylate cyclase (GGDEF)-like protein
VERAWLPTGTLALAALLWPAVATSAAPGFLSLDHYDLERGLSQASVTALAEDDHGFLWIGTQDGLNRFDGHRFMVQRSGVDAEHGLLSGSIEALAVDSQARLWIGTNESGLEVLGLRDGQRHHLGRGAGLSHLTVQRILLDPDGGAWIGTRLGVDRIDAGLQQVRRLAVADDVVAMASSAAGHFALDRHCALTALTVDRARPMALDLPAEARCVGLQPAGHDLWLATAEHGLFRIGNDGRRLQQLSPAQLRPGAAALGAFLVEDDGSLLVGFDDGMVVAGSAERGLRRVAFDRPLASAITGFHRQRSGVLWIGTYINGLYRARALSSAVRRDLFDDADLDALPSPSVRAIWTDGQRLMVGTDAGLTLRNGRDQPWQPVTGLGATSIRAIEADGAGGWWIGSHRGLWRMAPDGVLQALPDLPDRRVTALLVDGEQLWVATRGGLARFVAGRPEPGGIPAELDGQFLTSLLRDARGRLWIGSNDRGVFRLELDGGLQRLDVDGGQLRHDSVWSLHESADAWWIGTFSGGLQRIDRHSGEIRVFSERDGLSNNVIYSIVPDPDGRLWLSTNHGLSVLDPAGGVIQTLLPSDGLRNQEYNSGARLAGADGRLYFGGVGGLDVIDPGQLDATSPPARPVLTTLQLLGRQQPGQLAPGPLDIVYRDRIELGHRERIIALGMVALDFTAPDAARLRYRIRGVHDDWVQPQRPHAEVLLSYLPAGDYLLELEAAGRDGRFGPARQLELIMRPAPWEHPLAYAGYLLLAILLGLWLVTRVGARDRAKRAQIDLLNRTVASRTAELARANELLRHSNSQLQHATRTDPLTQVSNRRDLQHWLQHECPQLIEDGQVGTQPGRSLLFFMVDIDDFKLINDCYGHQVGDHVLVAFAERLRLLCRERDILVRWGGEEFLLLLRDTPVEEVTAVAERVRRAIADRPIALPSGQHLAVTCSIGFAPWPMSTAWPAMGDWESSVQLADRALYAAKAAGKNAWVGLTAGSEIDRACLQQLLSGTPPDQLHPGCVELHHSTAHEPELPAH